MLIVSASRLEDGGLKLQSAPAGAPLLLKVTRPSPGLESNLNGKFADWPRATVAVLLVKVSCIGAPMWTGSAAVLFPGLLSLPPDDWRESDPEGATR